jgi:ABC-type antimicrobial peptide transport system permease subunit
VKLDPAYYAMSTVPVELNGWTVVAVALGTMAVCIIAMLLPAAYVARIEPARSIRFE